jgi:hypothetical protein
MTSARRICCVAAVVLLSTPLLQSVPFSVQSVRFLDDTEAKTAKTILTKGAKLRGKVFHERFNENESFDADFVVKEIGDEEFIIEGNWTGDSRLALRFKYNGLKLSLVGVREGARTSGTRTNPAGKGLLNENGQLKSTFSWTVSNRRVKNQPVSGRIELSLIE